MESNYNEIDDLFREELSEHTEVPPPRVWNALEQRLDKDKKRRIFPFRWYWFVGLLFFITVLAGYFARTGGSDGADGGAAINVAGASVTAPAASDMNAAPHCAGFVELADVQKQASGSFHATPCFACCVHCRVPQH
jgi:hypothetical protein